MKIIMFYLLLIPGVITLFNFIKFKGSDYESASGNGFLKTCLDKGAYGEFLIYCDLEKLKGKFKVLTNVYLDKGDGITTEIDLILIGETGCYIVESKNYKGWIFGDEKHKNWTQTFKNNKKNKFFNPIWQNKGHINALKKTMKRDETGMYKSYIVFGNQAKLKKINVMREEVKVIRRNQLIKELKKDFQGAKMIFTADEVNQIYHQLQKFCLLDDRAKQKHIERIKEKLDY